MRQSFGTPPVNNRLAAPAGEQHAGRRLAAIDATRGLAVLGMIAVHSLDNYDEAGEPTWMFSLSAGRASAIFAVLAGVGIAFLTGRRQQRPGIAATATSWSLAARAVVIAVIGLALGFTDAQYGVVILTAYAAMFLLAVPLTYLGTRALAITAAALGIGAPVLSHAVRPYLPDPIGAQLSFEAALQDPLAFACDVLLTGEFPAVVWMTYVCTGLLLGRLTLASKRIALALVGTGATLMAAAAAVSWTVLHPLGGLARIEAAEAPDTDDLVANLLVFGADGTTPTSTWWWLGVATPHTGTPLDLAATIGSSLLVLGAMLLLGHVSAPAWATAVRVVLAPLAAIGSMSLTVYVGHILFVNSDFDMYDPWPGYLRQLVCIAALTLAWRATAGRGPLEGLVRFVTKRVESGTRRRLGRTAGRHAA